MIKKSVLMSLLLLFFVTITNAQEARLEVDEMVFCTAIEDRQPTGIDTVFSNTVEQVYCFTKINCLVDTTSISHVWYFNNVEMTRVELSVKVVNSQTFGQHFTNGSDSHFTKSSDSYFTKHSDTFPV